MKRRITQSSNNKEEKNYVNQRTHILYTSKSIFSCSTICPWSPKFQFTHPQAKDLKNVPRFTQSKDFYVSLLVLGFCWFTMCTKIFKKRLGRVVHSGLPKKEVKIHISIIELLWIWQKTLCCMSFCLKLCLIFGENY